MDGHLVRMVHKCELRPEDAALIDAWLQAQIIQGLSDLTIKVRARYISQFCRMLPLPVKQCTVEEIQFTLAQYRKTHSQNSTRQMSIYLGLFMAHQNIPGRDKIEEMMPARKWSTKKAADMLTGDDITAIRQACRTSRDRALVAVMYEGGFRPIELSRLQWGEVKWDKYGAVINTAEKTGKPRYIRLIESVPALAQWQQDCQKEAGPVFLSQRGKGGIGTHTINDIVTEAAERAGIKKRVFPYLLRHTRVTHLLEDGMFTMRPSVHG